MRSFILIVLLQICALTVGAQVNGRNQALRLDGQDNNVRTGIGILEGSWTLEAWIKGDDTSWKETEVLVGGGEYSRLEIADFLPLVVRNGRLHNTKANLWSESVLDDQWHHVALTCDGKTTCLYLDGRTIDSRDTAIAIIPGALGVNEEAQTVFGGFMDEVRVWTNALSETTIREWMNKPLSPVHPFFQSLLAYYNFDDGLDYTSVNWVGRGCQGYHLRNGRIDYKGSVPLAFTTLNDNPAFLYQSKSQELFNAIVVNSEWDADQGTDDEQILKLRLAVTGDEEPLSLTQLTLDLSEVTALSDISTIHVYYTGNKAKSEQKKELFGTGSAPRKKMVFKIPEGIRLTPGINYFLVTADINESAVAGNRIKISVPSFKLGKSSYTPEPATNTLDKIVTSSSRNNPDIVKVLQWNIWHGGAHLGNDGQTHVIDLIKASHADIVTMQEGYGAQQRIADSIGFQMQSPSLKDNLVLFSRYPFVSLPSFNGFQSNPAKITLPNGCPLLVNACWLRYAYNPEYTCCYPDPGQDTRVWVAEDSLLALTDATNLITKDINPHQGEEDIPVIIGGDFNSCSHLDWTLAAAPLHYGYGPVSFPTSRYLIEQGYKDSFREINPDEVLRPEGTFAGIYGQLKNNRIDYIYYKGKNIRALSSKIIQTAPDIDDVWASDHSAVLTTFEYVP